MSDSSRTIVIGTRGSALALAQAEMTEAALRKAVPGLPVERRIITTTGDRNTSLPLHEPTAEGAGLFTRQLEEALFEGTVDVAVHSLKDLPVATPKGLVLAAILPRAPVADLLITRRPGGLEGLREGAVVGSSSPRRTRLLLEKRPDLNVLPIRGNVPTRLAKVASGAEGCEATILAAAGLLRLGHAVDSGMISSDGTDLFCSALPWMLPAPGQGAVALEIRERDPVAESLALIHHAPTALCVEAERRLLLRLGGGCHMALGALALTEEGGLSLDAVYYPGESPVACRASALGSTPDEVAALVASRLLIS
jgi:hydroxymethylbilane synthase